MKANDPRAILVTATEEINVYSQNYIVHTINIPLRTSVMSIYLAKTLVTFINKKKTIMVN